MIPNAPPTIAFSTDQRVSGSTGCNQYSALFATDGNRITIGALKATEIGCDGERSTQDQVFLKGIDGASTWQVREDGALEIGGQVTLVAKSGIAAGIPVPSPGPAGQIEANYLAALADAKGWGIGGDGRLSLGGFHLMRFAPR